jgi:hypothetical protein
VAEDSSAEKAKKKRGRVVVRHRSERRITYENLNRPSHSPTPHPADDVADECATPDAVKGTAGNPVPSPGGRSLTEARVSPPLTAGHASPSSGDHGAACDPMNMPGPRELAYRHPDLRQGTTNAVPLMSMRSVNGDEDGGRAITRPVGTVGLARLDAAGAAGLPAFRAEPYGNPVSRPLDHSAPIGANNGGHSLADPRSHAAPQAMKSSDAREIMRRHMFPGSGGAR